MQVIRHLNQHAVIVRKQKVTWKFWTILTVLAFIIGYKLATYPWIQPAFAPTLAHADILVPTPTPTEHQQIIDYINQVFGNSAPKAFELLEKCGENASLNPDAQNYNDDPQHSVDIGVFQINTYWQGVTNRAFLFDWRTNIDMAYNIYVRNGNHFNLWTGGRKCGI